MCNEYRFERSLDELLEEFSRLSLPMTWVGGAPNLEPRASVRPTDKAPVLVGREGGVELRELRWGFVQARGGPLINFRSDGRRVPTGRCLAPMDGFYEFTGVRPPKSKWLFTPTQGGFLGVAGLVRDDRFTLLTCPPGPDVAPYHDRQIVILPSNLWAAWLNGPQPALVPAPPGTLTVTQVR